MIKRTPIYKQHIALKAKMTNFCQWKLPIRYTSEIIEHMNTRKNVSIFDVSHMGKILIQGKNAIQLSIKLFSKNFKCILNGQAIYSAMLTEYGTFIDDIIIYKISNQKLLICTNAYNNLKDLLHIKFVAKTKFINQYLKIISVHNEYGQLAIQGPKSNKMLIHMFGSYINKINKYHFLMKTFNYNNQQINIIIARTGYTGEDGFELFIPIKYTSYIWDLLIKYGNIYNLMPCGLSSRDTLRMEAGMALYGNEINEQITPLEAKLKWIINFKIKMIGYNFLLQQKKNGIYKILCGIEMLNKRIPRKGYIILNNKNIKIGIITSGNISPYFKKNIAMAYINYNYYKLNRYIKIKIRNIIINAKIIQLPFYKKHRTL